MFCYIFHNEKFFVLKITSQCSRVRIWTLTPCFASFQCSPTRRTVNNAHFCSLHVLVKFKCYYVLMLLLELCRINWSNHHVHLNPNDEEGDSTLTFVPWLFLKEFSENGFCSHSLGSRGGWVTLHYWRNIQNLIKIRVYLKLEFISMPQMNAYKYLIK